VQTRRTFRGSSEPSPERRLDSGTICASNGHETDSSSGRPAGSGRDESLRAEGSYALAVEVPGEKSAGATLGGAPSTSWCARAAAWDWGPRRAVVEADCRRGSQRNRRPRPTMWTTRGGGRGIPGAPMVWRQRFIAAGFTQSLVQEARRVQRAPEPAKIGPDMEPASRVSKGLRKPPLPWGKHRGKGSGAPRAPGLRTAPGEFLTVEGVNRP